MIRLYENGRGEVKFQSDFVYLCLYSLTGCSLQVNLTFPEEDLTKLPQDAKAGDKGKQPAVSSSMEAHLGDFEKLPPYWEGKKICLIKI